MSHLLLRAFGAICCVIGAAILSGVTAGVGAAASDLYSHQSEWGVLGPFANGMLVGGILAVFSASIFFPFPFRTENPPRFLGTLVTAPALVFPAAVVLSRLNYPASRWWAGLSGDPLSSGSGILVVMAVLVGEGVVIMRIARGGRTGGGSGPPSHTG